MASKLSEILPENMFQSAQWHTYVPVSLAANNMKIKKIGKLAMIPRIK